MDENGLLNFKIILKIYSSHKLGNFLQNFCFNNVVLIHIFIQIVWFGISRVKNVL